MRRFSLLVKLLLLLLLNLSLPWRLDDANLTDFAFTVCYHRSAPVCIGSLILLQMVAILTSTTARATLPPVSIPLRPTRTGHP